MTTSLLTKLALLGGAAVNAAHYEVLLRREALAQVNAGDDVLWAEASGGWVPVVLDEEGLSRVQSSGVEHEVRATSAPGYEVLPEGYVDYEGLVRELHRLADDNPDIASVVDLTSFGPGRTYEGRELPLIKISDNVQQDEDEDNYFIVSAHHAREIVTPVVALSIAERLIDGYRAGDEVGALVNSTQIYIMPTANPDGYQHVFETDNMWRKNRKPAGSAFGIDQNRNYEAGWHQPCSGSTVPSTQTYKGPSPDSEEETQIIEAFSVDRNFAKTMDYHSFGREVLYGFVCTPVPDAVKSTQEKWARELTDTETNYDMRFPSADGEQPQWQIRYHTQYSFLVETETTFQPSYQRAQAEAERVWPLTQFFLDKKVPLTGHIRGVEAGDVDIRVEGVIEPSYDASRTNGKNGRYHLWLDEGSWDVEFTFRGTTQTHTVHVKDDETTVLDVQF